MPEEKPNSTQTDGISETTSSSSPEATSSTEPVRQRDYSTPFEAPGSSRMVEVVEKKSKTGLIVITLALVLLLGALGYIIFQVGVVKGQQDAAAQLAKQQEEEAATATPTPTEAPEAVAKDTYEIVILNGSGVSGEAGRVKTSLEEEEYKVGSTGNADNSDYTETVVQVKEEVNTAWVDELVSLLKQTYVVAEVETAEEDAENDVTVIIGSEKASE